MTKVGQLFRSGNPYGATGVWIFGIAGLVVGMIHVGGITRLTNSGLSMTSWTPLGSLPPTNRVEWQAEFDRYKSFPEWQQRKSMTLSEFQFIYAWEYGHRMLGRFVGLAFCVPWIYFSFRRKIPPGYQGRMVGLLAMGGTQGLVGWWMVKSGLGDDRRDDKRQIRVKPLRLTAHLGMAMATYGALVWTGLDIMSLPKEAFAKQANIGKEALQTASRLRGASIAVSALTFLTVLSGALVAGNDAGRAYNTWPKMGDQWIPSDIFELKPWNRNLLENTATVQFNHRMLGMTTALSAISLAAVGLTRPTRVSSVVATPQVRKGLYAVGLSATAQFALGVTTLLHYVPMSLAAVHQLGSVAVFTSGIYLTHALRHRSIVAATQTSIAKVARSTLAGASQR
ncbi:hypothetical protein ACA910_000022 [Epithemia clementina (nom. ined.)]